MIIFGAYTHLTESIYLFWRELDNMRPVAGDYPEREMKDRHYSMCNTIFQNFHVRPAKTLKSKTQDEFIGSNNNTNSKKQ